MIIAQAPLRVSFFGGGTDFPDYYRPNGGAVLSTSINKHVFAIVKERFDEDIYLNYSRKEIVRHVGDIQHDLIREAMRATGVSKGIEITTLADVPSTGTGLGSSSAVLVAVLHALYTYLGELVTSEQLAREACDIEINRLDRPIGKQDQYITAFGGLRLIEFGTGEQVTVHPAILSSEYRSRLADRLLLFFTDRTRDANGILSDQRQNISNRTHILDALRDLAHAGVKQLSKLDLDSFGYALDDAWQLKKQLSDGISDCELDAIYESARKAGALGGKITGAGGGGFLLLYVPPAKQDAVRSVLGDLRELPMGFEPDGSKVIFNIRR